MVDYSNGGLFNHFALLLGAMDNSSFLFEQPYYEKNGRMAVVVRASPKLNEY